MNKNSREEDIKNINKGLYELEDSYELHQARWAKRIFENIKEKLEHILSDYKRVLKENEILKEEKAQAWEEWNSLEQGSYETEQRLKRENEELKERIREHTLLISPYYVKENFIPVQKVKDKIEELKQQNIFTTIDFIKTTPQDIKNTVIQELQELLEGRK